MASYPSDLHALSYGGGVNSTALMVLLVEEGMPLDVAVFADTGVELPETYDAVRIAEAYLQARGVPLVTVRSSTTLLQTLEKRRVIPDRYRRWQTRDKKVTPIHAFYRSTGAEHVTEYIGFDGNEKRRVKPAKESWITKVFPLFEREISRAACEEIITQAGLPIPHKSSCFMCPFRDRAEWAWMYRTHRDLYDRAMLLEESSKHYPRQVLFKGGLRRLASELAARRS